LLVDFTSLNKFFMANQFLQPTPLNSTPSSYFSIVSSHFPHYTNKLLHVKFLSPLGHFLVVKIDSIQIRKTTIKPSNTFLAKSKWGGFSSSRTTSSLSHHFLLNTRQNSHSLHDEFSLIFISLLSLDLVNFFLGTL
jgi:hypothetical protein